MTFGVAAFDFKKLGIIFIVIFPLPSHAIRTKTELTGDTTIMAVKSVVCVFRYILHNSFLKKGPVRFGLGILDYRVRQQASALWPTTPTNYNKKGCK